MAKGDQWERDLSKQMSLWWTEGDRDDVIWRVRGSGGRATARAKKGRTTAGGAGDLYAADPIAQPLFDYWLVEAKRGYAKAKPNESINVLYWLDKPVGTKEPLLYQWWLKAESERMQQGRHAAVIVFRRTGKRACIMMEAREAGDLTNYCGSYEHSTIDIAYGANGAPEHLFTLFDLDKFLDWCGPDTIKLALEYWRDRGGVIGKKRTLIP